MKTIVVRFSLAALIACVAQCAALPIRGTACYTTPQGEVCLRADDAGVAVTGKFTPTP